ncbi:hypothetical protein CWN65_15720, partial [Klebsiella pneumoniae]
MSLWFSAGFGGKFRPKRTFASASVSDADAEFRGAKSPTISWLVPFYSMRKRWLNRLRCMNNTRCAARAW